MISHSYRCIAIHIPKTAGNSINRAFGIGWEDHKDLARYHAELSSEVFDDYFKFAVVRNPWERLLSDYNFQLKKRRPGSAKLFVFDARGERRNFAAWVEEALACPHAYAPEQWGGSVSPGMHRFSPQLDWITVGGVRRVDFLARCETLDRDFATLCRHVGLPPRRLPHRNRKLHLHYSHYYDRSTREQVGDYYARDIAAFRYDFEDRTTVRSVFNGLHQWAQRVRRLAPGAPPARRGCRAI